MKNPSQYHRCSESLVSLLRSSPLVRCQRVVILSLTSLLAPAIMAQDTAVSPTECRCRAPDGQMLALGTVQCVSIVGRRSLVRCEMSTNTPYWNRVEGIEGCPDA